MRIAMQLAVALLMVLCSCGASEAEQTGEQQGKEYTSTYVCPMHCMGSGSEEAGICPVCGMDYVLNETKKESHNH